jgi:hypothetical protein
MNGMIMTLVQKEYIKYHMEDKFLNASDEDDFIALQTYSIRRTSPNIFYRALSWIQIKIPILRIYIYPRFRDIFAGRHEYEPDGIRTTKMGYEYRPQAILYNLHRIHIFFLIKKYLLQKMELQLMMTMNELNL